MQTIIVFIKETVLSSAEIQEFLLRPITTWAENVVSSEDWQKRLKVVFA